MGLIQIFKKLLSNKKAFIGFLLIIFLVIVSLLAPKISSYDPYKRVAKPHEAPSLDHFFGSTRMGRDVFSQVLHGGRISLGVGFLAGTIVCFLAVILGVTSGYFGGRIDDVLTFIMNVVLVIPNLPLLLVLASFVGEAGPEVIAIIIGLTSWAYGARVIRAQTMAIREKEFIKSAEVLGESSFRIVFAEILPNLVSIVSVSFIGSVIYAVVSEATLEFIGLGDPTIVTWGTMLYNAQTSSALLVGAWWEVITPCIAISLLGGGLALINFGIDEISNPGLRSHSGIRRWKEKIKILKLNQKQEVGS